jgi:hypothetical protein
MSRYRYDEMSVHSVSSRLRNELISFVAIAGQGGRNFKVA